MECSQGKAREGGKPGREEDRARMGSQLETAWAWPDPMGSREHEFVPQACLTRGKGLAFCTPMPVSHGLPAAPGGGGV